MSDISLSMLANIAEVIGAFTVVTGVAFGAYQVRLHRIQQHNNIASELTQTFLSPDLARAVTKLRRLPDSVSAEELLSHGTEMEEAAILVTTSFETMGLLVYRNVADLALVQDLAGGILSVMWRKLRVWQESVRVEQDQPSWAEWFEWLAVRSEHK